VAAKSRRIAPAVTISWTDVLARTHRRQDPVTYAHSAGPCWSCKAAQHIACRARQQSHGRHDAPPLRLCRSTACSIRIPTIRRAGLLVHPAGRDPCHIWLERRAGSNASSPPPRALALQPDEGIHHVCRPQLRLTRQAGWPGSAVRSRHRGSVLPPRVQLSAKTTPPRAVGSASSSAGVTLDAKIGSLGTLPDRCSGRTVD